jgi:hypothetical protein
MTVHTRTANLSPGFMPATTAHTSTSRLVLVAASVLLQAVIVMGFVASSLGVGGSVYADSGRLTPPAPVMPVSAIEANAAPALEPAPAPAPAP